MQRLYTCGVINKNVADTEEKKKILEAVYKYAIFILWFCNSWKPFDVYKISLLH